MPLNVMLRKHHRVRTKISNDYKLVLKTLLRGKIRPIAPLEACKITIIRYNYRLLDYDNCVASYKNIIDLIVRENILIDDNYKVTGPWDVSQVFRSKQEGPLSYVKIEGFQETEPRPFKKGVKGKRSEKERDDF